MKGYGTTNYAIAKAKDPEKEEVPHEVVSILSGHGKGLVPLGA